MFRKGNKLYSVFNKKCPRCHEGDLFKSSILSFQGIYNMHENCTVCGQDFQKEPGFYWGAMYIGYMLSSGYMLSAMVICIFIFELSLTMSFVATIAAGLLIVPFFARMARSIWINIYVRMDRQLIIEKNKKE